MQNLEDIDGWILVRRTKKIRIWRCSKTGAMAHDSRRNGIWERDLYTSSQWPAWLT